MQRSTVVFLALVIFVAAPGMAGIDAGSAFETLKSLEGVWVGSAAAQGAEADAESEEMAGAQQKHVIQVSANGTVVMETMGPGTPHEMINMYTIDGDDLVLTHYCAGGNQPTMKLDLDNATADNMPFMFTGGANFDPETDQHIHNARIVLDGNSMESKWVGYHNGEPAGTMVFSLERTAE